MRVNLLGEDAYTALYPEYQEVIIFKRKMNQKDWGFQWPFEQKYLPRCEFLCIFVEKNYLLREDLSVFSEKIESYAKRRLPFPSSLFFFFGGSDLPQVSLHPI